MRFKILIPLLLVIFSCSNVFAIENDIGFSKITPNSPIYFLKVLRENFELKLALTPHVKLVRQLEFATRRLREAKTLVWQNQDLIAPTLQKYGLYLNNLPDKDLQDKEVATRIKESLGVHLQVLLQEMYYQSSSLRAKMSIRAIMNNIIQRADVSAQVKVPICDLFLKEATMSATLNQTEKIVLLDRANKCRTPLP